MADLLVKVLTSEARDGASLLFVDGSCIATGLLGILCLELLNGLVWCLLFGSTMKIFKSSIETSLIMTILITGDGRSEAS